MLILLPPSETKRVGGSPGPLDIGSLSLPELAATRESVIAALIELSRDEDAAARVLKLSARQRGDIADNAALRSAPVMAAVDRYTGVLFDALDAASLDAVSRRWLGTHVLIHSAPFGPVGAMDMIPRYRLAAGAALPGVPPLARLWSEPVAAALNASAPAFVLDLRSEAYRALGPVAPDVASAYVRVVTEGPDGAVRALNHFNKHAKGVLVRRLALERPRIGSIRGFTRWAEAAGIRLAPNSAGELQLFAS